MSLLNSIRTEILKIVKNDPKKIDYKNKEIDFKEYEMNKEEYINSVCNFKLFKELEECNPIIEFTNKTTKSLWKKILCHTSSVKTLQPPGKSISYFIKSNDKIIGLVSLTSGQRDIANRDAYIGWNRDYQYQNVNFIFNISTCVAVQPLGYNFNIGKLLASSVFCKEVQEKIKEKYGHYAIAYYTFSIHGRSIQYERLKELKYVGLTKGKSFIIPEDLYEMMKKYVKEKGLYNKIKNKSHLKRIIILTVLEDLEIDRKKVYHHLERGIYVGYSFPESKQILCEGKIEEIMNKELPEKIKSFDEIFNFWKGRWAEQS